MDSTVKTKDTAASYVLKQRIGEILIGALQSLIPEYRNAEGFVRWGLVERDIYTAIDAAFAQSTTRDIGRSQPQHSEQRSPASDGATKAQAE